jgi:pimeloyl-ACP methyl ester carboxylesterase
VTTTPAATLRLRDGRTLTYSIYGDPSGTPLLHCHGGLVCRLDIASADKAAKTLGIRIIAPDRPGVGRSDRRVGRTLLDWVDDACELLGHHDIDQFATIGWSMGGQYALALAHVLGSRVDTVTVVAGCPPLDNASTFDALSALDKRLTRMSKKNKPAARATFAAMRNMARHLPNQFVKASARNLGPHDTRVVERPATGYAAMMVEGLRQTKGAVDEYLVFVEPWGFELDDITTPVRVWWGDQDRLVSKSLIDALVKPLPACELTVVPDAGHFVAFDRWRDVLAPVAG